MPKSVPALCLQLLDTPASRLGELRSICLDLHEVLTRLAGACPGPGLGRSDLRAEHGRAIGGTWAALCLQDFTRTRAFAEGVLAAVRRCRRRSGAGPVHVLYAGCGPFASLALPTMAALTPEEVRFTLIDLNAESLGAAKATLSALGWLPFVREFRCADACTCALDGAADADVLLSETLNGALRAEPFVAILMNLVPQLAPTALLVPEQVRVSAVLSSAARRMAIKLGQVVPGPAQLDLGTVMTVDRDRAVRWASLAAARQDPFPVVHLELPGDRQGCDQLSLETDVTVHGGIHLPRDASGLTLPWRIRSITEVPPGAEVIRFQYRLGEEPGFVAELR